MAREVGFVTYHHEAEVARQLPDVPLSVNPVDAHPSAALNRIYGEKLVRVLARETAPYRPTGRPAEGRGPDG